MIWKYAGRYVLPFSPSNMKMDIRWNTALADTISSVRTRSLSKEYPQFTVKYSALLKGAGLQFATDRVLRDLDQEVLVPMWQDVATERISDTEVAVLTDKTFYREGMLVILWASDTEWQIVEVEQVNPSYVKFGVNNTDWVCVAPIEEGFMAASPSTSTDRNRNTKLDYSVVIKRLDGPLSTTGGGVIPGVYVNSFIGNGVDSGVVVQNNQFTNFVSATAYVKPYSVPNVRGTIFSMGDGGNTDKFLIVLNLLSTSQIQVMIYSSSTITEERKYVRTLDPINLNEEIEVFFYLDLSDPTNQIQLFINGTLATVGNNQNVSFSTIYNSPTTRLFCGIREKAPNNLVESFEGEISRLYYSTNSLAITPELCRQYAIGQEHFTQIAPDVVPTSVNSFIGNGVDSGVVLGSVPYEPYIACSFKTIYKIGGKFGYLFNVGGVVGNNDTYMVVYTDNGELKVYSSNASYQKVWTTGIQLTDGVEYSIQTTFSIVQGYTLILDNIPRSLSLIFNGGIISTNPSTLDMRFGFSVEYIGNIMGEGWELYWSTNPLAIDKATIIQYATGQEHFTQIAPDALPSAWLGGAVQGEIKEGWLGGAVQGEVEVSPPSGGPPGPYPEDPKLTRTPIQSTKANSYSLHLNTIKSVGGVLKVNSMRSVPTVTTTHTWDNQNRAEYLDMLDFAARCRGRKNAFDTASFKCDLIPITEGVVGNGYLDVLDPGLQSLTLQGTRFTVIRGSSWDSSEVYEILSLENVTGGVRLVLDKAIAVTIFTTDAVSNIRQSRLASDVLSVEIDSFNRSSSSIAVRDINEGG